MVTTKGRVIQQTTEGADEACQKNISELEDTTIKNQIINELL
ncbi:MAG TPA: hypothetical protein VIP70_01660 [Nitrososphaeraceae archaeon]